MLQHSARQNISAWTDITMVLLAPMCSLLFEVCTLYTLLLCDFDITLLVTSALYSAHLIHTSLSEFAVASTCHQNVLHHPGCMLCTHVTAASRSCQ